MKYEISKLLAKTLKGKGIVLSEKEIEDKIEVPPSIEFGDYSFPCFFLASKLRENPEKIANDLRNHLEKLKAFERVEVKGAYLNFFVKKKNLAKETIKEILAKKESYGKADVGKKKKILIDFSQPNTHKAFHVGHIRGTSFGESIARINEFCGNKSIRVNYSGDTGMHVAKWIWCYLKHHSKEKLRKDESWIASIYVDASNRLKENEKLQEEVNQVNEKIENRKDKKINELWQKTRKLSIDSWKVIYKQLNAKFDKYYFESQVEERGKEIVLGLLKKGIAKKSDGAIIMDFSKYNLGVWILLRTDETTLYSTKEFGLFEKKVRNYNPDKSIVVVANEQDLYFKQFEKTIELMGLNKSKSFEHITYGLVRLPTGKMSSRTGDNILYSDFMEELTNYAKEQIIKRNEKISKKELDKRSLKISVAAIKYSMLKQNPGKDIIFQKEEALKFEGDTGPYLLYSYARASSILRKSKIKPKKDFLAEEISEKEYELAKKLSDFPKIVLSSYKNLNPSIIANYSYQLSQIFNEFYHSCKVLGDENENSRILLVESFKIVLKSSLSLLGIETIEKM